MTRRFAERVYLIDSLKATNFQTWLRWHTSTPFALTSAFLRLSSLSNPSPLVGGRSGRWWEITSIGIGIWSLISIKLKKRKIGTSVDAAIDTCKGLEIHWHDRVKIAEVYIRELVSRSKPISTFSVKSAVNVISIKLCPDDQAIKQIAEFCYQV